MAKKYKPASEKTIAKGKGISTDELSFKDALKYFQDRGKERGMNRFRHKGKVYDLSGKEISPKATPKATPKAAPKAKEYSGRGDGAAEVKRRQQENKKYSGRGNGASEVTRRKKAGEEKSTSTFVPAAGAAVAARGGSAAQGRPYNPNYGKGGPGMAEGFQGRYQTGVARAGAGSGAPGINSGKVARKLGTKGGRRALKPDDFNPFLN